MTTEVKNFMNEFHSLLGRAEERKPLKKSLLLKKILK